VVIEATGTEEEIDRLVELVTPFGIKELVRTGSVVMLRGGQIVAFEEKS
jgi:acetolactate synthase-1/3 small subunit